MIKGFEDLIKGLSSLVNKTPVSFNIHFSLNKDVFSFCNKLNSEFVSQCQSDIDFSNISFHLPHITLYMGSIDNLSSLEKLFSVSYEFSCEIKEFKSDLSKPYNKGEKAQWIFMDLVPNDIVNEYKKHFDSVLRNIVIPVKWNFLSEPPHITIARLPIKSDAMFKILNTCQPPLQARAISVDISIGGNRGTCLGTLKSFPL